MHTPPPQPPQVSQLRRVRWAVRFTLVLGVAASVAANVLHARPDPVAQIIAAWPPLALLLTVELISRVPVDRRMLAAARLVATTAIAAIAAWVSYWHMAGVAARYGEHGASPYLLPLSVDGLVIVASVSLVELAGRIRITDAAGQPPTRVHTGMAAAADPRKPVRGAARPAIVEAAATDQPADAQPVALARRRPGGRPAGETTDDEQGRAPAPGQPQPAWQTTDGQPTGIMGPHARAGRDRVVAPPRDPGPDRPPADPREAAAYWRAKDPTLRPAEIAAKVGRSERTVRRILAGLTDTGGDPAESDTTGTTTRVNGTASKLADSVVST